MAGLHQQFSRTMVRLLGLFPPRKLAIAVSGGVDSMALTSLSAAWAQSNGVELHALVADHKLRRHSTQEAEEVASYVNGTLGVPSSVLTLSSLQTLEEDGRKSRLEEMARHARQTALFDACRQQHASHLLLGHHLNDQIELFIMRLLAGSSWFGLAGMSALARPSAIFRRGTEPLAPRLVRPLLEIMKRELIAYCTERQIRWWEDSTNREPLLTQRNLIRQMYELRAEPKAVSEETLVPLLGLLAAQRQVATNTSRAVFKELVLQKRLTFSRWGRTCTIKFGKDLQRLPPAVLREVLVAAAAAVTPATLEKVLLRRSLWNTVVSNLTQGTAFNVNLVGTQCQYEPRRERLTIRREPPRKQDTRRLEVFKATGEFSDWTLIDNRFYMRWKLPLDGADTHHHTGHAEGSVDGFAESPPKSRLFDVRLVADGRPVIAVLQPMLAESNKELLHKNISTEPFLMWHDAKNPDTISAEKAIGFPTLGVMSKELVVEVAPRLCTF